MLRKGCQGYLAFVRDVEKKAVDHVTIVTKFPDVFPEELPGLPLKRNRVQF